VADATKNCVNIYSRLKLRVHAREYIYICVCVCVKNSSMYVCMVWPFLMHSYNKERERNRLCVYECNEGSEAKMCMYMFGYERKKRLEFYYNRNVLEKRMSFILCIVYMYIKEVYSRLCLLSHFVIFTFPTSSVLSHK
jgi:hypothetical protein